MNPSVATFRTAALIAGNGLRRTTPQLNREFGLNDFLANDVQADDDDVTIAVNAVVFFCEDHAPNEDVYRFGVVAACIFLHLQAGYSASNYPQQVITDLVSLIRANGCVDEQVRRLFDSHFPEL